MFAAKTIYSEAVGEPVEDTLGGRSENNPVAFVAGSAGGTVGTAELAEVGIDLVVDIAEGTVEKAVGGIADVVEGMREGIVVEPGDCTDLPVASDTVAGIVVAEVAIK